MLLDSRGNPAVEAEVQTQKATASAIMPEGASTGSLEAMELRDGGKAFLGKGVKKAIANVNETIAPKLKGLDSGNQKQADKIMLDLDSTSNKSRLGANAILPVSIALCKASAAAQGIQVFEYIGKLAENKESILPVPLMNVINGGKHAGDELAVQEFMLVPLGAGSYSEALQFNVEIYQTLKQIIKDKFGKSAINVGDEGGFAPSISKTEDVLKLMQLALKETGYEKQVRIALDFAANSFHHNEKYIFEGKECNNMQFLEIVEGLIERFNLASVEDPFAEQDWQAFCALTKSKGAKCQIVGDDLLVTSVERIQRALKLSACNSVIIKPNQVGTVTETLKAVQAAKDAGFNFIISHRSGDSEDDFIADLAVGTGALQIKAGAPARSERTAKYNRLLRIEEMLGKKGEYAGKRLLEKFQNE
ncbi:MAG TPA: phosphopyruvate hydratase [Candidatus Diapherotrites archaeon]|uniref:Enolase n=1 Tax=Candidatus Iainarchaeum sp. TaxID=3101447 RepID=A0A7J4KVA9_9ARCH|nr:phosphopyruvate hydratase [Candidatus Diapherotrites archaeon]